MQIFSLLKSLSQLTGVLFVLLVFHYISNIVHFFKFMTLKKKYALKKIDEKCRLEQFRSMFV